MASNEEIIRNLYVVAEKDPKGFGHIPRRRSRSCGHLEDGKVSAFDCHYAGTILLGQLGVLGNLEASLKK